jgi:hypothetical protein
MPLPTLLVEYRLEKSGGVIDRILGWEFFDSAGREESRCLDVLLCLAFGIFGWEDGTAQAGKGQDEECFLMPGVRNRIKAFLFLKISVS